MAATVLAASPDSSAIERSDAAGGWSMNRSAAGRRAARGHGYQERVELIAVDELNQDLLVSSDPGGAQAVHSVDHAHSRALDQDRREFALNFGQPLGVRGVQALNSGRIRGQQRVYR